MIVGFWNLPLSEDRSRGRATRSSDGPVWKCEGTRDLQRVEHETEASERKLAEPWPGTGSGSPPAIRRDKTRGGIPRGAGSGAGPVFKAIFLLTHRFRGRIEIADIETELKGS